MLTDNFFVIAQWGHEGTLGLLIVMSIFSLGFIIERWLMLKAAKKTTKKTSERVREILQSSDYSQIETLARDWDTIEGRALSYGLRHIKEKGPNGLEEVFSSYALTEKPKLEKHLTFLATVGSNAPFIGLLGTVFGIMDAFRSLATSQGDAAMVMIGISKALVATAIGLMVAIPAVVAYNVFQKQVKSVMQSLESVKDLCVSYSKNYKGS